MINFYKTLLYERFEHTKAMKEDITIYLMKLTELLFH